MNQSRQSKVCSRCGRTPDTAMRIEPVLLRVPGRATAYQANPVKLCEGCREEIRGSWKWLYRR